MYSGGAHIPEGCKESQSLPATIIQENDYTVDVIIATSAPKSSTSYHRHQINTVDVLALLTLQSCIAEAVCDTVILNAVNFSVARFLNFTIFFTNLYKTKNLLQII